MFNFVDHKKLLSKLYSSGVRGLPFQWRTSYLLGRTQLVFVNIILSTTTKIKLGAPQGSILGPVIFLLYVNGLNHTVNTSAFLQYADDKSINIVF